MVRDSETSKGDFSLCFKSQNQVQHLRILRDGSGKYFIWEVKFNSINELISHHKNSSISRFALKEFSIIGSRNVVCAGALTDLLLDYCFFSTYSPPFVYFLLFISFSFVLCSRVYSRVCSRVHATLHSIVHSRSKYNTFKSSFMRPCQNKFMRTLVYKLEPRNKEFPWTSYIKCCLIED